MRWIQAILSVFLILLCLVRLGLAQGSDCASYPSIHVTVKPVLANPVYDFSANVPDIQSMANDIVHRVRQGWALGFTSYQPVLTMDAPVAVTVLGGGKFCAQPRYVNIDVGTRDETVYIPREIPGESCGFSAVIEHEQKHLAANRQMVQKYAALIETKLNDYFKTSENAAASTSEDATAIQQNRLRAVLGDVAEQMILDNSAVQQDIDTPEEYQRLLSTCNGELAELVKSVREERSFAQRF